MTCTALLCQHIRRSFNTALVFRSGGHSTEVRTMENRSSSYSRTSIRRFGFARIRHSSTSSKSSDFASSEEENNGINYIRRGRSNSKSLKGKLSRHISQSEDRHERNMNVLVLGASSVGKTSIIKQFLGEEVSSKHKKTLQDIFHTEIKLGGTYLNLKIEDTGSSFIHEFPIMAELSLENCNVVALVYSIEDPQSFEEVSKMRDFLLSRHPSLAMVIVGNKTDLERKLPAMEIEATVCLDWDCGYVECSAWEERGVEEVFRELAMQARIIRKDALVQSEDLERKPSFIKKVFRKTTRRESVRVLKSFSSK